MSILSNLYHNLAYMWRKDSNDIHDILSRIETELKQMALNLDVLRTEIERVETVDASAVVLLQKLLAEIEANKDDPAALQGLVDRVRVATDALAAAVATVPVEPPVEPPVV
jgi:ABC-type transporter Mla MlaB component